MCPEFSKNVPVCNIFIYPVSTLFDICSPFESHFLQNIHLEGMHAAVGERINCITGLAHSKFIKNDKGVFCLLILVVQATCPFVDRYCSRSLLMSE